MPTYNNDNSGTLGRNQRKTKPTQPDFTGSLECTCVHCGASTPYWLSAWVKTAGAHANNPGSKFFSLAVNPKDAPPAGSPAPSNNGNDDFDDDIPF